MNIKNTLLFLACGAALVACDDETATLGVDMMPVSDIITKTYRTYDVVTRSYPVGDSVLARSSTSYIGRFTDPETGTMVKSDFLSQFHINEGFAFPDSIIGDSITSTDIRLYVNGFVGDSLTSFKVEVYELDSILDPNADYYSNINPQDFYDVHSKPIASKWFTLSDRTISDSVRWNKNYANSIRISLPREIGQQIYDGWRNHPEWFENTSTWIHSGLPCSKGVYYKLVSGDGAMAYIDVAHFSMYMRYYDKPLAKDTTGVCQLAATEEVIEATRFENTNLDELLADVNATYLKSPAGIFTQATLPVTQINYNDTINSAKLTFTRYNDLTQGTFKLSIPKNLLLVRMDDYLNGYFEKYTLPDSETSYLATFNPSNNTYQYPNIARLLSVMLQERKESIINGTPLSPNWDKILLIPIEAIYDNSATSKSLVRINHDFSMTSARLVGGETDRVSLEVMYSSFESKVYDK